MYSHNTCHVNRTGSLYGSFTEGNYIRYCSNKCIQTSECTESPRLITCISYFASPIFITFVLYFHEDVLSILSRCFCSLREKIQKFFQKESKLSKVFPGPHFPVFGMNTDIYSVNIRIQSKYRKIRTRKNSVFARFSRRDSERESLEIHTHNAANETNENKIIRILQTRFHILQFLMFLFNFISCKVYYKFLLMTRINGPLLP